MRHSTEQALINQLNNLASNSQLCNGIYPTVKLSKCSTGALHDFIDIYICGKAQSASRIYKNYNYLLGLLSMINNNRQLLSNSDNQIWGLYRQSNSAAPPSHHQLSGIAKALISGGFYP